MMGQTASLYKITHERLLVHVNVFPSVSHASSEAHHGGAAGKFHARRALPNRLMTAVAPTRNRLPNNPFIALRKSRRRLL